MELIFPVLLALAAFASTLAGGLLVLKGEQWFHRIAAFAAGLLIAVALFDLLPEALSLASSYGMSILSIIDPLAVGFVLLLIVDRYLSVTRECEAGICRNVRYSRGGLIGAGEMVAHSLLDGFAIGVGFRLSPEVGAIVATAVISHGFTDGINTVTLVISSGNRMRVAVTMLLVDAAAPVVGAVAALFIAIPEPWLPKLLAFFAGGFLYLGASNLLPEAHENSPPLVAVLLTLAGFAVILALTRLLHVGF